MIRFEDLVEKVGAYTSPADVELLRRAFDADGSPIAVLMPVKQ